MKTKIYLFFILISIILWGCYGKAKETTQDGDFKIEFLFEYDDCKVYRFKDGNRYIYWSNCKGKIQSDYTEQRGKNNTTTIHMESLNQ